LPLPFVPVRNPALVLRRCRLASGMSRFGAGVYGPTYVAPLAAGSVATKALPPRVMLACSARFRPADVTHRATEFAVNPFRAKSSVTAVAFWLIATIANLPVLGSLYADTDTPPTGLALVPIR